MVAAVVVQEGKILFEGGGPATGAVAHLVPAALPPEAAPRHVLHGDVVVVPVGRALAAAVAQKHRLVAVVAQAQFADRQLQLPHRAGLGSAGSLSPSGLALAVVPALPSLPVQQSAYDMLQLALREALEYRGKL